ncbi:MAG: hypothetical protein AAGF75_00440 [Cyanobacteria bacterium P01_H01_bin.130]
MLRNILTLATLISPLIALTPPAIAQTPTFTTNDLGRIISIENLAIADHGTYRVTFHSGTYAEHFTETPTFFGDKDGARAAAEAISTALSDRHMIAESSSIRPSDGFRIPYDTSTRRGSPFINYIGEGIGFSPAPGIDTISSGRQNPTVAIGIGADTTFHIVSWAKFTPAN